MSEHTIYYGTLIHSVSITEVETISQGALVVDAQGIIVHVEKDVQDLEAFLQNHSYKEAKVISHSKSGTKDSNIYDKSDSQVGS
jgi:guanine deaminase